MLVDALGPAEQFSFQVVTETDHHEWLLIENFRLWDGIWRSCVIFIMTVESVGFSGMSMIVDTADQAMLSAMLHFNQSVICFAITFTDER